MHLVAIVVHAAFGVIALVSGVIALEWTTRALGPYLVSLIGMLLALGVAIAVEWSGLDAGTRVLFAALGLLGLVVVARGVEAVRLRPTAAAGGAGAATEERYIRALGFTIVALVDAFVVVLVLDLGAPVWTVVATAVVVAVAGHQGVRARVRARAPITAR